MLRGSKVYNTSWENNPNDLKYMEIYDKDLCYVRAKTPDKRITGGCKMFLIKEGWEILNE